MKKQNIFTKLSDFNTSATELKQAEQNGSRIMQNHYGDFLMIEHPKEWGAHNYRVWLNHPDNVREGSPVWQIEYNGENNGYTWETVGKGNR
jgi:hypothetical protein